MKRCDRVSCGGEWSIPKEMPRDIIIKAVGVVHYEKNKMIQLYFF